MVSTPRLTRIQTLEQSVWPLRGWGGLTGEH